MVSIILISFRKDRRGLLKIMIYLIDLYKGSFVLVSCNYWVRYFFGCIRVERIEWS